MVDMTIVDAAKTLDDDLSAAAINFLLDTRRLVITVGQEIETEAELLEKELIQAIPFSHPRVSASVMGYVPTDNGQKVLTVMDDRHWSNPNTPISAPAATSVQIVPEDADVTVVPEDTVGMSNEDVARAQANGDPIQTVADDVQKVEVVNTEENAAGNTVADVKPVQDTPDEGPQKIDPEAAEENRLVNPTNDEAAFTPSEADSNRIDPVYAKDNPEPYSDADADSKYGYATKTVDPSYDYEASAQSSKNADGSVAKS